VERVRRVMLPLLLVSAPFGPLLAIACGDNAALPADPGNFMAFGEAGVDSGPECDEATKDPFVLSEAKALYAFHPPDLAFKSLGPLSCQAGAATPTSMAVDRRGIAWVRYSNGSIWKVSTKDLACEATTYASPLDSTWPFFQFGMGFSSKERGSSEEQLYLSDALGNGHGKLDVTTLKVAFVGPYTSPLANRRAELTGTGDGRLYGFFVTKEKEPTQIAEIVKATGVITNVQTLPTVLPGNAYAFSFYGGDFYIYTNTGATGSAVTRFRPGDGSSTVVVPEVGFKIVGAGVSTCAPLEGPR
jgi:hypothetical protein